MKKFLLICCISFFPTIHTGYNKHKISSSTTDIISLLADWEKVAHICEPQLQREHIHEVDFDLVKNLYIVGKELKSKFNDAPAFWSEQDEELFDLIEQTYLTLTVIS